eukprot:4842155-Pyramimonas_sp.AAC.1
MATERMRGCRMFVRWRHANAPIGAFGGPPSPHGAANRVGGVRNWARWTHTNPPTGAFGGTPWGQGLCEGCAELGVGAPCNSSKTFG